jgi:hypothetical protein
MVHKQLIADLGGACTVQGLLAVRGVHVKSVTVRSWCLDGRIIPAKYWIDIKAIADARDVALTFGQLASAAALGKESAADSAVI